MRLTLLIFLAILITGCSSNYENTSPLWQPFPNVSGVDLENKQVNLPEYFKGVKTLLLIGYKQNSQFDIDRWLIGLEMTETKVSTFELPTIKGMFPRMFSTYINNGMRAGIPKELWKGVITIYDDGEKIQSFTGNENPNNARVVLLDKQGKIIYMYDRGFSVSALTKLRQTLTN